MPRRTAGRVVLSPHRDDAVLSCFGLLDQLSVTVVNVFAGVPAPGTSTAHDRRLVGGGDSCAAVRVRRAEDRRALGLLGRAAVDLPFLDGPHRRGPEPSVADVRAALLGALGGRLPAQVYAPAGLGLPPHTDHVLVRRCAESLRASGSEIWLYADFPYVYRASPPCDRGWRRERLGLTRLRRKRAALASYERTLSALLDRAMVTPAMYRDELYRRAG